MKTIMIVVILLISTLSYANTTVRFTWDANTESDLAGYRLYETYNSGEYSFGEISINFVDWIPAGTEQFDLTLSDDDAYTLFFVLTAFNTGGLESGASNEVYLEDKNSNQLDETGGNSGCFIITVKGN